MKNSEGKLGRVFIIRLEDGEKLPVAIENFAADKNVMRGTCILIGGIKSDGKVVVGPEMSEEMPPVPVLLSLAGVHEVNGVGTLFPDKEGKPVLHMHATMGRGDQTRAGCIRHGVEIWQVGEVILIEIIDNSAKRLPDEKTGFELLEP